MPQPKRGEFSLIKPERNDWTGTGAKAHRAAASKRLLGRFRYGVPTVAVLSLSACQIYDQVSRVAPTYTNEPPAAMCLQAALATASEISDARCSITKHPRGDRTFCEYEYHFLDEGDAVGRIVILHPTSTMDGALDHRVLVYNWSDPVPLPSNTEKLMIDLEQKLFQKCDMDVSGLSRGRNIRKPRIDQD